MLLDDPALLKPFRAAGNCEWCGMYFHRRDAAHWRSRGSTGGAINASFNLMGMGPFDQFRCLCHRRCHGKVEGVTITSAQMLAKIALRERVKPASIITALDWIARLDKCARGDAIERPLQRLRPEPQALIRKALKEAGKHDGPLSDQGPVVVDQRRHLLLATAPARPPSRLLGGTADEGWVDC